MFTDLELSFCKEHVHDPKIMAIEKKTYEESMDRNRE
jgi:hypothetical protein